MMLAKKVIDKRIPAIVFCAAALLGAMAWQTFADVANKKTIVTFNSPVEVPGKVLPPGTYVFKLLDSSGNRNIVQIFDKDETKLYATLLAIPDYRMDPPEKPIIQFEERASNAPPAIKEWFYPGDTSGMQFVYPQDRATQLAKRTNQNVLSMRNEMSNHISAPAKTADAPSVQAMQNAEVSGVSPTGEPVDLVIIVAKPKN
jgi:hypothetical protein